MQIGSTPVLRIAAVLCAATMLLASAPANIGGAWQFKVELSMGTAEPVVTFKQDGEKITGTYEGRYGTSNLEGTVRENEVEFNVTFLIQGDAIVGAFAGTVEGDRMTGQVEYEGAGEGQWTAVRMPAKKQP
jgi:L-seryl-tRNA(Ser) seleniumtransferase